MAEAETVDLSQLADGPFELKPLTTVIGTEVHGIDLARDTIAYLSNLLVARRTFFGLNPARTGSA